jgi:hypothetical protein
MRPTRSERGFGQGSVDESLSAGQDGTLIYIKITYVQCRARTPATQAIVGRLAVIRVPRVTSARPLIWRRGCSTSSLGTKAAICAGWHVNWLRICVVADLKSARLLPVFETGEFDSFEMSVPGGGGWFVLKHQHLTKRSARRDQVPTMVNQTMGTKILVLTVI